MHAIVQRKLIIYVFSKLTSIGGGKVAFLSENNLGYYSRKFSASRTVFDWADVGDGVETDSR